MPLPKRGTPEYEAWRNSPAYEEWRKKTSQVVRSRWRAIRNPILFSGGVVLLSRSLHRDKTKIRGYSGCSLDGRTLEPAKPELGYPIRREAVGKGPEVEEQTRFRIPKL